MKQSHAFEFVKKPESSVKIPLAPKGLSLEARTWWRKLNELYEFGDESLLLLEQALEAFDEVRAAQKILARDGLIQRDRFGQRKSHPATAVLRDSRSALLKYFSALHLSTEPILGVGRPPDGGME